MKGLTLLETIVVIGITIIFFTIASTSFIYFYQFPPFDLFRDSSTYRTVFFEISKTIKEASAIKNIYSTLNVNAIYLEVGNNIYAYRLRKNVTLQNRKLEKSVDRGYNWFELPNTSNIEDIVFRAPANKPQIVSISMKTFYPQSKLTKFHHFIVKIRKQKSFNFVISGIDNNNRVLYSMGSSNNWSNFTQVSNRISSSSLNIDNFVNSFDSYQSIRVGNLNNYQLWKFSKANYNSKFIYDFLDTSSNFFPAGFTTPGSDNDWLKVIAIGDYLYTAYATQETIYNNSNGNWETNYSVYFAYKKVIPKYWQVGVKSSWLKKRVFSIRTADIGNGYIRFVRLAYGNAVGNKFHITFCIGNTAFNSNLNDFYYLGSQDGKNWVIKNIDNLFNVDNINPLFVVPLVGNINGTDNQLHFVFVNRIANNNFRIYYISTNDLINFSVQDLSGGNPSYRSNQNRPISISNIYDFEAIFFNGGIHLVFSCNGSANGVWAGQRGKLIYMLKNDFNLPAVYNIYPTGNNSINFTSNSISIGGGYVHILSSSGGNLYYLRQTIANSLYVDFLNNSYSISSFQIRGIDSHYSEPYLHVSFYLNANNNSARDLDYLRIMNPSVPVLQRINNSTIDDNLSILSNSIDNQVLFNDNIDNGAMSGVVVGNDGYLHFLSYVRTGLSLGEIIYIDPNSNNLLPNGRFDTLLVHRSIPFQRSINVSNGVVSYTDNNGSDNSAPVNSTMDIKLYIYNSVTEIDGNRRIDISNNTDIVGSRSCGFYNDIEVDNGAIYVAYSERVGNNNLRLRLARSMDLGQSWQIETADPNPSNPLNAARDINLKIKDNFINIVHRNNTNRLVVTKKNGNNWFNYQPLVSTNDFNIRAFLDNSDKLHILSFSSNNTSLLVNKIAYYRVFNNVSNTFLNTGLISDSLVSAYLGTFSSIGPYGDIFVDSDNTVYILVNTVRMGSTNYTLDLIVNKDGVWQNPISIPPNTPISYLLNSLRINKW